MARKLIILALLLWPLLSPAQHVQVSAQVQDANGDLYSNCSGNASFRGQASSGGPYLLSGSTFQTTAGIFCDSQGNFSVTLADNNQISPTPSQWNFSICSAAGYTGGPFCFNILLTITGTTQNITSQIAAIAPVLPVSGTVNLSAPPRVGNVTPNTGAFSDLVVGKSVTSIGDSFGFCFNVSTLSCWFNVFASERGITATNSAVSSTGVADPGQFGVVAPLVNTSPFVNYAYCCAINDMRNNLTSGQQGLWQQGYEALLWWLATPETNKVRSTSASVTYAGTWVLPPSNYSGNMNSCQSNGATASFSVYGSDIVVIGGYQVGNSSTWNVSVDGAYTTPTITTSTNSFPTVAFNTNYGPNFVHISGLVEQTHNIVFTCVTASAGNPGYFIAGGTSFGVGASGPFVYALETTKLVNGCGANCGYHLLSTNCSDPCGSDILVAQFDMLEAQAVHDLANVGLNVILIPLNAAYVPVLNTTTQSDGVHPNNTGSTQIGNALIAAAKGYLTPMDRSASQTFTSLNPCTANASGGGMLAVGGLGVGAANSCPAGMQRGDIWASQTDTVGRIGLGHDGTVVIARNGNAISTNGTSLCLNGTTTCIYTGAGAPSTGCGASNTGSIYMRNDAPSASTVEYVCQGSTWTAVTVP